MTWTIILRWIIRHADQIVCGHLGRCQPVLYCGVGSVFLLSSLVPRTDQPIPAWTEIENGPRLTRRESRYIKTLYSGFYTRSEYMKYKDT